MRILRILVLLTVASPTWAAISSVQILGTSCTLVSTCTRTISATHAGNFLYVSGLASGGAAATPCTDSASSIYTVLDSTAQTIGCFLANIPAGITSVTLHAAASSTMIIDVTEWSGVATVSPLDQNLGASVCSTANPWASATTGALAQPSELAMSQVGTFSTDLPSLTETQGFNTAIGTSVPSLYYLTTQYKLTASTSPIFNGGANSGAYTICANLFTFKGATSPSVLRRSPGIF